MTKSNCEAVFGCKQAAERFHEYPLDTGGYDIISSKALSISKIRNILRNVLKKHGNIRRVIEKKMAITPLDR